MQFSMGTVAFFSRFYHRAVSEISDEGGNVREGGREFDPATIITIANIVLPLLQQLMALCKKTPPPTPPTPQALTDAGVTDDTYEKAFQSNWGATQAWNGKKYHAAAVNQTAKAIAAHDGSKKKVAKPAAIAAFSTSREEDVDTIALAMHEAGN